MSRISVFGLGPVGLVTARKGHQVVGTDPDLERLERIRRTEPPLFEPQLGDYLAEVITNGTFSVTNDASVNAQSDLLHDHL